MEFLECAFIDIAAFRHTPVARFCVHAGSDVLRGVLRKGMKYDWRKDWSGWYAAYAFAFHFFRHVRGPIGKYLEI